MASAYSYDLRVKVINFLENKGTIKEASRLFNINRNTVIAWKKLKKTTGDVHAKTGYQVGHRLIIKDTERFKRLVEEHNDKSAVELAKLWHEPVSSTSVLRLLKKLCYSYKKTFVHPKRDDGARSEFIKALNKFNKEQLVFLDESGIDDNACPLYGWSTKGSRCYGKRAYQHKRRVSMIAGLFSKQIIAPVLFEGTCNTAVFLSYVEHILIKELKEGQIVVMDNINFHKNTKVRELIESAGCSILFLPTYSPDLNPIEHYWFKIKHAIRKVANQFQDFLDAVYSVLQKVYTL